MSTRAANKKAGVKHDVGPEEADPAEPREGEERRSRGKLHNWRVRSRLIVLVVIPTVATLLLGGTRIVDNVSNTFTHERIERMAVLGEAVSGLSHEIGKERLLSAAYIASAPDPEERSDERQVALEEQRQAVDRSLHEVRTQVSELGEPESELAANKLATMMASLDGLDSLRTEVSDTRITVLPAVTKYRQLNETLITFNEGLAEGTDNTALRESVRAFTALTSAREELSYEAALVLNALMRNSMSGGSQEAIRTTRSNYDNEIDNFTDNATVEQRTVYDEVYSGLEVSSMATMRLRVTTRAQTGQSLSGITTDDGVGNYESVALDSLDLLHSAESAVGGDVTQEAAALKSNARTNALVDSAIVLLVVFAVFALTTAVARSMVGPLRSLRDGALRVADRELPEAIDRVRETDGTSSEARIAPIDVHSGDEIGEVARSFDEVHRVALRLASEESALRNNVNAMFVNLSRRSQTLVERQLRLIEGLEHGEEDADRLGDLFQLDHLATRMRRNNENLLVLSGQENTRKWSQPVPLVDVLRAAISEVEQYDRVNVRASSHISVLGRPVNDVIHLLAELVENATSYSSHDTYVLVEARILDGGDVMIEVSDSGIGMSPEEIEQTNERLAEPPKIDVAVSRRMGLFVVSRLAARHGVQVRLRAAHNGGITALVVLPADLLITPVDSTSPALGTGRTGVPDTYAEATAAFAASPPPADPAESWQAPPETERAPWQAEGPGGLPKRPTSPRSQSPETAEHPPSGQDLWTPPSRPDTFAGQQPPTGATPAGRSDGGSVWESSGEARSAEEHWDPWTRPSSRASSAGPPAPERPAEQPPASERPAGRSDGGSVWESSGEARSAEEHWGPWTRPSSQASSAGPPAPERPAEQPPAEPSPPPVEETRSWNQPHPNTPLSAHHSSADSGTDRRTGQGTSPLSRYGESGNDHTVVPPAPQGESDSLPIFDSIESNWFRRRTVTAPETGPMSRVEPNASPPAGSQPEERSAQGEPVEWRETAQSRDPEGERPTPSWDTPPEGTWQSEADVGWRAAESVNDPTAGGMTSAGLPKRVPKANLVPGAAPTPENSKQLAPRSADRVRNRLAGLQRGVRQGRNDTGEPPTKER